MKIIKIINKRRRFELKMLKYRRRLKLYGLESCNSLRTTSRPCNCWVCKKPKYNRKKDNYDTSK